MPYNLFPAGYDEQDLTVEDITEKRAIGYKNGPSFDDELGDFLRDGGNRILDSDGIDSWISWCKNCIATERYKHLAYNDDFGIEVEAAMKASSREEAESILTRQITEALMADPYGRVEYVERLDFEWTAADAVEVTAVIHGINDVTIDITAYITKGDI